MPATELDILTPADCKANPLLVIAVSASDPSAARTSELSLMEKGKLLVEGSRFSSPF